MKQMKSLHLKKIFFTVSLLACNFASRKFATDSLCAVKTINPWFITGFADAEGCFWLSITKDAGFASGWRVRLGFEIHLHLKDKVILEEIQNYFNVGKIYEKKDNSVHYVVKSFKDLEIIVKHFNAYPLITKKQADFELWKKAFYLFKNKDHLTVEGLQKFVAIRSSLNRGLTAELESAFQNIVLINRPDVVDIEIKDPAWIAGFTTGEGSFQIKILNSLAKTGATVRLSFQLTQHMRDEQLMLSFIKYFGGGFVTKDNNAFNFRIEKFSDICNKIIPFFFRK